MENNLPGVTPTKKTLLMCNENLTGYKLEELLSEIAGELLCKSTNMLKDDRLSHLSSKTVEANSRIVNLLLQARDIQVGTLNRHKALNPAMMIKG